uniref:Transmembrane domain-containing protein n=1 Tax=Spironucleus salmonicida TaxID=348837 RepID=V6LZF9_9EUKA|eukprot:EST49141.1 Transmembrane domain-containing protein [Spironucleus salmonicida]
MGEFSSIFQITLKSFIRQRYFVVQFLISFSLALLYIIIFSLFVQPLLRTVFDTDTTEVMQNSSQLLRGNYGIVYSDPKQHSFTALHPNANVLSATSTSTDTIIISMTQSSSQYGISLDDLGSIVVTKQQNQVILPVIQALNLDFHNIRIGRLPHQSLKLAQSLTPFSALLTIFFTVLDYMLTLFLDQYQKSKLEGRTQFILLNGASKAKWHTYHLVLVAGAMFVFMCVIMTILSVIGAQFARVNVLIWAIVGLLYYFQSGAILLLLGKYSQTITGYYQLGQYVSLLQTISLMVLMFQSTKINQGLLVLLQLMPQVALNNVILAMFYAGYNHDNKSLEFIYENFNLYYTIIIQLIEIAVFLAIVIFTDPSTVRRATNQCVAVSEEVLESQFSDTILKHVRLANQQVQENNFQDGILIYGVSKSYGNTLANKEITMQIRKNSIWSYR